MYDGRQMKQESTNVGRAGRILPASRAISSGDALDGKFLMEDASSEPSHGFMRSRSGTARTGRLRFV
jgi:hypothetical protein